MLKSRITRIIAGFIGCAMMFVCVFRVMNIFTNDKAFDEKYYHESVRNECSADINDIYSKLWIIGMMYLRNLDEKGEFKGSEAAEAQTVAVLQEFGVMDNKKELLIDAAEGYEYLVNINGMTFTNTDKTYDELSGEYSLTRRNDGMSYSNIMNWMLTTLDFNWYTTNYGMTYYDINGRGRAIFDFDTTGCKSYIDEMGATIYYKLDGTTPVPYEYLPYSEEFYLNEDYSFNTDEYGQLKKVQGYDEYGNPIEAVIDEGVTENPANEQTSFFADNGLYVYRANEGRFFKIDENNFIKTQGKEAALTIAIRPGEDVIADYQKFADTLDEHNTELVHNIVSVIPFGVIALIMLIYVLIAGGWIRKEKRFALSAADKIFAELPIGIIILTVILGISIVGNDVTGEIYNFCSEFYTVDTFPIVLGVISALLFGIIMLMLNTVVIRLKCHSFWKTTLIYRILRALYHIIKRISKKAEENIISRDMLNHDKFTRRFLLRTFALIFAETIVIIVCIDWHAEGIMLFDSLVLLGLYLYLSFGDLKAIKRLNEHITEINSGNYAERSEKPSSPIYAQTEKLNNISAGIQNAVDRQLKSERMKIDLVTNVSHDLKTPLTSIISYIDLLSAEELPAAARDYVKVIDSKSQRLKTMVADLFDLAKATSRTDVQLEQIDAVVLTGQVLGDLADKIEASGRDLRTDIQADTAPVRADGKRMYRVFQNLIDNALKYSLDGTRIYMTVKNENGYCLITVKNIASYEMTFNPEEITERFTRGDESRSTEGNGLGLSIAKSFTEACGGQFGVNIDGDVFTATISLPILN